MDELRVRLVKALERLHPGKTEFSIAEVMEALEIMGEFQQTSKPQRVRKSKRYA